MVSSSDSLDFGLILLDGCAEVRLLLIIHLWHSVTSGLTPKIALLLHGLLLLTIWRMSRSS